MKLALFLLLMLLLLGSCVTPLFQQQPISSESYFREAQSFLLARNYKRAIDIYRLLEIEYPDDFILRIRALFATAQAYWAEGEHEQAIELYQTILDAKTQPEGASIPASFIILAEKNLAVLQEELD